MLIVKNALKYRNSTWIWGFQVDSRTWINNNNNNKYIYFIFRVHFYEDLKQLLNVILSLCRWIVICYICLMNYYNQFASYIQPTLTALRNNQYFIICGAKRHTTAYIDNRSTRLVRSICPYYITLMVFQWIRLQLSSLYKGTCAV